MSCGANSRKLDAYVDGALGAAEAASVAAHLGACEACRERERSIAALAAAIRAAAPEASLGEAASYDLLNRVKTSGARPAAAWTPAPVEALVAAVLALIIGVVAGIAAFDRPAPAPGSLAEWRGLPSSAFGSVYSGLMTKGNIR